MNTQRDGLGDIDDLRAFNRLLEVFSYTILILHVRKNCTSGLKKPSQVEFGRPVLPRCIPGVDLGF